MDSGISSGITHLLRLQSQANAQFPVLFDLVQARLDGIEELVLGQCGMRTLLIRGECNVRSVSCDAKCSL